MFDTLEIEILHRIHDLLHPTAALKFGADLLFTLDSAGFAGLTAMENRSP